MDWISVKHKLPPIGEDVLVYCGENNYFISCLSDAALFYKDYLKKMCPPQDGLYKEGVRFYIGGGWAEEVTHWMEIPKFKINKEQQ